MLEEIIKLRSKGLSFRKIAKELESTVGKVQYQWNKYMKGKKETTEWNSQEDMVNSIISEESYHLPKQNWTSIQASAKNGMEAWLIGHDTAFVFWHIPDQKKNLIASYYGISINWVVRVCDITSIIYNGNNAHSYKQFEIEQIKSHLLLNSLTANRSYCFELGVYDGYQSFLPILQSNPIQLPRTDSSQVGSLAIEVKQWAEGKVLVPNWIEHVSTYSYYDKEVRKGEDEL